MYEAMNKYIDVDTWHSAHPLDDQRFYEALAKIIHHPDFDSEAMGAYMRERKGIDIDNENQSHFNEVIEQRISQAGAIKDFKKYY